MTIWNKNVNHQINPLPDGSSGVLVTHIGPTENPVFLINMYMPTHGSANSYARVPDEMYEIMKKFREKDQVLWRGDFNGSFDRANLSSNDSQQRSICKELQLISNTSNKPTYQNFMGGIK